MAKLRPSRERGKVRGGSETPMVHEPGDEKEQGPNGGSRGSPLYHRLWQVEGCPSPSDDLLAPEILADSPHAVGKQER